VVGATTASLSRHERGRITALQPGKRGHCESSVMDDYIVCEFVANVNKKNTGHFVYNDCELAGGTLRGGQCEQVRSDRARTSCPTNRPSPASQERQISDVCRENLDGP